MFTTSLAHSVCICTICHKPLDRIHRTPALRRLPFCEKFTCPMCQQNETQVAGWLFRVK
jgi:hypothetical protein